MGANITGFNDIVLSMVDDVPVNTETPMVTYSISRVCGSVFEDNHKDRVCVCAFVGVSVWVSVLYCVIAKKKATIENFAKSIYSPIPKSIILIFRSFNNIFFLLNTKN
jgi:hypothetical protein